MYFSPWVLSSTNIPKAFERQVARRVDLIKETSRRHEIRGFDMDLDDELIQEFMTRLGRMYQEQAAALEKVKVRNLFQEEISAKADSLQRETRAELSIAQEALNKLNAQRSSLVQRKEYARSEIRSLQPKIMNLQRRLDETNVDEGQEAIQQAVLDESALRIQSAKQTFENHKHDEQSRALNTKLRDTEEEIRSVTEELSKSTRQADDRARLGLLKKEQEAREKALDTLYVTCLSSNSRGSIHSHCVLGRIQTVTS